MRESALTARIKRALEDAGAKVIKTRAGGVEAGTPDLIGCYQGQAFVLEVKVGWNQPTPLQRYRLSQWRQAGAYAVIANEEFDLVAFLGAVNTHRALVDASEGVKPLQPARRPHTRKGTPCSTSE